MRWRGNLFVSLKNAKENKHSSSWQPGINQECQAQGTRWLALSCHVMFCRLSAGQLATQGKYSEPPEVIGSRRPRLDFFTSGIFTILREMRFYRVLIYFFSSELSYHYYHHTVSHGNPSTNHTVTSQSRAHEEEEEEDGMARVKLMEQRNARTESFSHKN